MTVSQMCELGIRRAVERHCAENTVRGYRGFKSSHIENPEYGIARIKAVDLRSRHVEAMMDAMDTGRQTKLLVRSFLRYCINKVAIKAGIVDRNEAALADPPAKKRGEGSQNPMLTPDMLALILKHEINPVRRCLYLMVVTTGLRLGEARHLTWHNFSKQSDGVWVELDESKTEEGLKPVPVPSDTWAEIEALGKSSVLVFPSKSGTPFGESNLRTGWKATLKRAGLPYTNPYKLRHLFGSMKARYVSDDVLARLMRHTDVRTSKQYYVEPFPEDLRDAVEKK